MKFIDLTGQRFGTLVAVERTVVEVGGRKRVKWICRCDCGRTVIRKHEATTSCGHPPCMKTKPRSDLTGSRFGKLTAIETLPTIPGRSARWRCICDCGKERITTATKLKTGMSTSCGCGRKVHGHTWEGGRTSTYRTWQNMIARCHYPSNVSYEHYKKLGVTVCDRWRKFEHFLADMGERPFVEASIERINNAGNYEPGNCRWASMQEQGNNRSTNIHFEWRGKIYTLADLARASGVSKDTLRVRLVRPGGWSVEDAINTPVTPYKSRKRLIA